MLTYLVGHQIRRENSNQHSFILIIILCLMNLNLNHIYPETRQIYLINKDKALKLGGITKGNVLVSFYGIKLFANTCGG